MGFTILGAEQLASLPRRPTDLFGRSLRLTVLDHHPALVLPPDRLRPTAGSWPHAIRRELSPFEASAHGLSFLHARNNLLQCLYHGGVSVLTVSSCRSRLKPGAQPLSTRMRGSPAVTSARTSAFAPVECFARSPDAPRPGSPHVIRWDRRPLLTKR